LAGDIARNAHRTEIHRINVFLLLFFLYLRTFLQLCALVSLDLRAQSLEVGR
jgi:hypothetical protein